MRKLLSLAFVALVILAGVTAPLGAKDKAAAQVVFGKLDGQVLTSGGRNVVILGADGKVLWKRDKTGLVHDAWMLPGGNVLYADGNSVTEVTRDQKVVFEYKAAEQKGGGAFLQTTTNVQQLL